MELKQLTDLGVSEEIANKVLGINAKELETEKGLTAAETAKLTAANTTIQDLTGKVKAFDGVDVEGLKTAAGEWETKYNTDLAALKLDKAVELALVGAKARDTSLVKTLIDTKMLKLDDKGNLAGLTEQLEKVKTEKNYLFEADKPDPDDTSMYVNSGADHKQASAADGLAAARAVMGLPTQK